MLNNPNPMKHNYNTIILKDVIQIKYMGSKSRIAKEIVPIIQYYIDQNDNKVYVEPFVGGANVIDKIKCNRRLGFDINKYLIRLFQHIQAGGELPEIITREEYSRIRANIEAFPEWYAGCVGLLASYNGRFFDGGYAGVVHTKANTIRDYYDEARRNLLSQAKDIVDVDFECMDYRAHNSDLEFKECIIYCDPPYEGVKQYGNSKNFDHNEFWSIMREWSKRNIVLISECNAPDDFRCIWQQDIIRTVDNTKRIKSVEKLFIYKAA